MGRRRFLPPTLLFALAALLLVVSVFLPYWRLTLVGPEHPEGLTVEAYLHHVEGDRAAIDALRSETGLRSFADASGLEWQLSVTIVGAIALLSLAAVWVHSRWALLSSLPALLTPLGVLVSLQLWLWSSDAAPPILGELSVGRFHAVSEPGVGLGLAFLSSLSILLGLTVAHPDSVLHRRADRK